MVCSQCQTQNSDSARFCNNCGATLTVSQSADDVKSLTSSNENAATIEAEKKDKLIGRTIEGRYRIDSLIGLGGMGSVYRVTRLLIGDEVAMKILHSERVADPNVGERFRREAQAAARLKHPNAVSIYDFGITSDGLQYLVMELLEGQSLRQIIKQEGPLPSSVAAEITTQVCAALDEAHQRHIVHRDIKPDNIIINSTITGLRVKVLDFGIAKLRDDVASHLTQTGSVMGTPHYMSPEQCLGEELDSRADIYSMGIVLYEMLCGRVPFNSPVSTAVVVQHVNQPPQSLCTINIGISPQVEAVVFHALEKQRDARPPTASALARELTAAVHPTSVQAPSHSTWPQMSGPLQPPTHVTDETVMRSAARTPTANELPATVYLPAAQASGSTPSVRSTVPSGALGVARTNQRLILKIGAAVFGVVLLGAVVVMIAWSLRREGKPNDVAGANTNNNQNTTNPTPPAGMAYVQGGEFTMGDNAGEPLEQPAHKVTVQPFFIDINEVTREEYEKFLSATDHRAPEGWVNGHYPSGTAKWPVTGVDWDDATAYAKSAGKRLPTEEEWEFAARGTDGRRYPWGNEWSKGLANADSPKGGFSDVGSFKGASPYGLFDMVGNAWEWTASDLAAYPGGSLLGSTAGRLKVIRGGCFLSRPDQATTTIRVGWPARGGDEYDNTSFRCVKDAPPVTSQPVELSEAKPSDLVPATITEVRVGSEFTFPIVNLPDQAVADRINLYMIKDALGDDLGSDFTASHLKKIFTQQRKQEYAQGLASTGYDITLNIPTALSVSIPICYVGAHYNCGESHFNFDPTTGNTISLDQIIMPSKLNEIKKLVANNSKKRLVKEKEGLNKEPYGWHEADWQGEVAMGEGTFEENWQKGMKMKYWEIELGKEFTLSKNGITFFFGTGIGLPMSMREMEPDTKYFYSWAVVKPFLIPSSPISVLVK